jgi:hypothetical protein
VQVLETASIPRPTAPPPPGSKRDWTRAG